MEEILSLEKKLYEILPAGEDCLFGTDGSHEALADIFEYAWDKTEAIALEAINALKEIAGEDCDC